jgi:hypothetical protein
VKLGDIRDEVTDWLRFLEKWGQLESTCGQINKYLASVKDVECVNGWRNIGF